jgi:hypothetical protein
LELFELFEFHQVRRMHGITEKSWSDQRLEIANEIEDLGPSYRIQLRSGWVKYLEHANAHGIVQPDIVPQATPRKIVVTDE